jgi:hypothetical protein
MSQHLEIIREATLKVRHTQLGLFKALASKSTVIPPTWRNHLHWHLGHLILTPRLLTYGLLKEDLGVPATYRPLFAKDSTPLNWKPEDQIPSYEQLLEDFIPTTEALFAQMATRGLESYSTPYVTSPGVVLENPLQALNFSQFHDGIHLGLTIALRRALG